MGFAERMEFWNKLFFVPMLEKYAISEQENELFAEIDLALALEEPVGDDDSEDEEDNFVRKHKDKHGKQKKKGYWRKNLKQKRLRKQRRLARKLKNLKCM